MVAIESTREITKEEMEKFIDIGTFVLGVNPSKIDVAVLGDIDCYPDPAESNLDI